MLSLPEARERILTAIVPLSTQRLRLTAAAGRVLGEELRAPGDLPRFANSAMDGYAVRAADLAGLRPGQSVGLQCVGKVAAGAAPAAVVTPGTCIRLFTGSPLPAGADTVVMQEDTRREPGNPEVVWFHEAAEPGENVRQRGEDIRQGQVLLPPGVRLTVGRIALLGALGVESVAVGRQPRLALLATGSELREAGEPLGPGQIYESNRAGLATLARRAGARPTRLPLVPDEPEATQAALARAFHHRDVVVSSGGVSVGEMDWVKSAFTAVGGNLEFWRVAVRPGKPFVFGRWRDAYFFGLPGNPVSALVTFWLLVAPALARLQGVKDCALPTQTGVVAEALVNQGDRPHFLRVRLEGGQVRSAGLQASHALGALAQANGLVEVPPATTLPTGTVVPVLTWD